MMKLSELRSAAEIHEQNMLDPEYKREYDCLILVDEGLPGKVDTGLTE